MSLIHWWPLNGDAQDKITTTTMIPGWGLDFIQDGKIGSCFYCSSNYLTSIYQHNTTLNDQPTEFSIALWLRLHDSVPDSYAQIFTIGREDGFAWEYMKIGLSLDYDNIIRFVLSNDNESTGYYNSAEQNLFPGQWYHIVATFNTPFCKLYIDGKLISTVTTDIIPDLSSATIMNIGGCINIDFPSQEPSEGELGECDINDVRVYDHELSLMEIKELNKVLVLHYTFNDNLASQYLINEAGVTYPTVAIQNYNTLNDSVLNKQVLDCENNTVIHTQPTGDITHGATMSLWTKYTLSEPRTEILMIDTHCGLAISITTEHELQITSKAPGYKTQKIDDLWLANKWNHIVVTCANEFSIPECYLNGIPLLIEEATQVWPHQQDCIIGCLYHSRLQRYSGYYTGLLSDCRLYYSYFTPEEVKELYNCGGRISNLGDATTGSFIEGESAIQINKNHTIDSNEIIEQDEAKASFKKNGTIFARQIIET